MAVGGGAHLAVGGADTLAGALDIRARNKSAADCVICSTTTGLRFDGHLTVENIEAGWCDQLSECWSRQYQT
jgi:hypothetical protein